MTKQELTERIKQAKLIAAKVKEIEAEYTEIKSSIKDALKKKKLDVFEVKGIGSAAITIRTVARLDQDLLKEMFELTDEDIKKASRFTTSEFVTIK